MRPLPRFIEVSLGLVFFALAGAVTMARFLRYEMAKDRMRFDTTPAKLYRS